MYEGIFEDFEIIKRHSRSNGNLHFEELAVFELLENLAPQHGPGQAVQMILEMLDAQTVRDCNNIRIVKAEKTEATANIPTDDSNDSIIEIKVQKKNHPVIDLTDDSTLQLNETSVIEKTGNSSSINIASEIDSDSHEENFFGGQSDESKDSDIHKNFDNYWNPERSQYTEEVLAMLEVSNQSNPFENINNNPNLQEVSEMLEENNNDPNNNLDGTIFEEEYSSVNNGNNNNERVHIDPKNTENLNDRNILKTFDPVPGCSKDTDENINDRVNAQSLPYTTVKRPASPIAGCSKDFDNSNSFHTSTKYIESIKDDEQCIKNLLPWADSEIINSTLEKYGDSPNRKQLALWDLVSEASIKANKDRKRKQDNGICTVSKKCLKMEVDMDDSLDDLLDLSANSLNHFDNIFNESNDSISNSEFTDIYRHNQNSNISVATESSNALPFNRADDSKKLIDASSQLVNNGNPQSQFKTDTFTLPKVQFNNQNSNSAPIQSNEFTNRYLNINPVVKKERVETVVSGSLNGHSSIKTVEHKSKEINNVIINNLNNRERQQCINYNDNSSNLGCAKPIYKEKNALDHLLDYDAKVLEWPNSKSEKSNLIKPAKLNINHKPLPVYENVRPVERPPYIRPASFSLENRSFNLENKKIETNPPLIPLPVPHVPYGNIGNNKNNMISNPPPKSKAVIRSNVIKIQRPKIVMISEDPPEVLHVPARVIVNPALSVSTENYDRTIYSKLRSMFPDIKSSYIKSICKNPPVMVDMSNKSQAISILIDHLLEEGSNHIQPIDVEPVQPTAATVLSIDEQYEYLLGIFPDADPTYLRKFVEENINKENVFEQFIQEKLEKHDYPTKQQYLAKIKVTEQIKEYTTGFNVEKFLEMFPDPFKHFEDEKRQCVHQPIALEFLKSHFQKNKITTICRYYAVNKYNLSLTAKALTNLGYDMKSKRMSVEMPTEDIPLLQEMAFVKHKQTIICHINSRKAAEDQLFKELQEKNMLLTCQCCFNEECMPTKCAECNDNHLFCYDCVIKGTEMALAGGEAHVKCFTVCQSEFSLATLQKVLTPTTFSALLKKRQAAEVMAAEVEGLVSCPFCHFASIPPPEDKVFKCLNPECMKETCRQCKDLNHVPLRCDEVIKTDKARLLIEEKMTEALLRTCYKCKRPFYKEDGCNKMTCTCGAAMCYLCNKPINGYKHFNAQGGVNSALCPLWSDDKRLNAEAVIKVAEDYKKVIMEQNPNLKIDTTPLLPKLPPRSKGPHDDIPNANQLPEHILRVIGAGL